jgi:phytoene synthase
MVDASGDLPIAQRAAALYAWSEQFNAGLAGEKIDDPILLAVLDTIATFNLDTKDFSSFLQSMGMDLTVCEYQEYADLLEYMEGSAAAIGSMTLPLLDPVDPTRAREPARQLGLAFQLTNFLRDIGQDLSLGRVYLPREDLENFGVTRDALRSAVVTGTTTPAIRALIAFEIARARTHYAAAAEGVPMLGRAAQACVRTAFHVYACILEEIER